MEDRRDVFFEVSSVAEMAKEFGDHVAVIGGVRVLTPVSAECAED